MGEVLYIPWTCEKWESPDVGVYTIVNVYQDGLLLHPRAYSVDFVVDADDPRGCDGNIVVVVYEAAYSDIYARASGPYGAPQDVWNN